LFIDLENFKNSSYNGVFMRNEIKSNVLFVLKSVVKILSSKSADVPGLKKLSNDIMEDVSLFQDQHSISVAVMVYSLYKILAKNENIDTRLIVKLIRNSISSIDVDAQFRRRVRLVFDAIEQFDKNIDMNIIDIIKHAQIKKGLKVYEHGLSIGLASEIMGISKWDLMQYLGSYGIVDKDPNMRIDQRARLEYARGLFK